MTITRMGEPAKKMMACPISTELQEQLEIKLETLDYNNWHYHTVYPCAGHNFTLFIMFKVNKKGELYGEFQHLGYTATRHGLENVIAVMAQMDYPPAVTYLRKQIIDEMLESL